MPLSLPISHIVAFCEKIRKAPGMMVENTTPVDPTAYGVAFNYKTGTGRYSIEYCTRMGMDYVGTGETDCQPVAGTGVLEILLGTTVTKGLIQMGKEIEKSVGRTLQCGYDEHQIGLDCYDLPPEGNAFTVPPTYGLICPPYAIDNGSTCHYDRGVGKIPNKKACPANMRDDGTSCWLDTYGRGAGHIAPITVKDRGATYVDGYSAGEYESESRDYYASGNTKSRDSYGSTYEKKKRTNWASGDINFGFYRNGYDDLNSYNDAYDRRVIEGSEQTDRFLENNSPKSEFNNNSPNNWVNTPWESAVSRCQKFTKKRCEEHAGLAHVKCSERNSNWYSWGHKCFTKDRTVNAISCPRGYTKNGTGRCTKSGQKRCEEKHGKGKCEKYGSTWYPPCSSENTTDKKKVYVKASTTTTWCADKRSMLQRCQDVEGVECEEKGDYVVKYAYPKCDKKYDKKYGPGWYPGDGTTPEFLGWCYRDKTAKSNCEEKHKNCEKVGSNYSPKCSELNENTPKKNWRVYQDQRSSTTCVDGRDALQRCKDIEGVECEQSGTMQYAYPKCDKLYGPGWTPGTLDTTLGYCYKYKSAQERCEDDMRKKNKKPKCETYGGTGMYPNCEALFGKGFTSSAVTTCEKADLTPCEKAEKTTCEKCGALAYPKCKEGYEAAGCNLCQPKGRPGINPGPRIEQTLFDRQYCDSTDKLDTGMCYTKPKDDFVCHLTGCHKSKELGMTKRLGPVHTCGEGYVKRNNGVEDRCFPYYTIT